MVSKIADLWDSITENFDPRKKLWKLVEIIDIYVYVISIVEEDQTLKTKQVGDFYALRNDIIRYLDEECPKAWTVESSLKASDFEEVSDRTLEQYKSASQHRTQFSARFQKIWGKVKDGIPMQDALTDDDLLTATEKTSSELGDNEALHQHPDGLDNISTEEAAEPVDMNARHKVEKLIQKLFRLNKGKDTKLGPSDVDDTLRKYPIGPSSNGKYRIVKDPFLIALEGSSRPTTSMDAEPENFEDDNADPPEAPHEPESTDYTLGRFSFE